MLRLLMQKVQVAENPAEYNGLGEDECSEQDDEVPSAAIHHYVVETDDVDSTLQPASVRVSQTSLFKSVCFLFLIAYCNLYELL